MPDDVTKASDAANAEEIKRNEATETTPRGNVHSEADEAPGQDAPPPMPS